MSIAARNITRAFGDFVAVNDVSIEVASGELIALLGPSGSGKTTLLRIIAGLESADSGQILFHGEDATDTTVGERQVGFVFQHYALFRHMTVFENVAFGLRVKPRHLRPSPEAIRDKVMSLLKLVQLEWLAGQFPHQLSGGQRQRIALARALAVEPKVLLLDEPFGALDAKVRKELRAWLRRLHDEIHVTSLFVTHDQEEALEVSDRVVVMNKGRVEQVGTPDEVYDHPASPFVYEFLGDMNIFHGRVHDGRAQIGGWEVPLPGHVGAEQAAVYVRPHDIEIFAVAEGDNSLQAVVTDFVSIGPRVRVDLQRVDGGERVHAEIDRARFRELRIGEGDRVALRPRRHRVFTAAA
jgi:sulfate transport system ATP-binding protein